MQTIGLHRFAIALLSAWAMATSPAANANQAASQATAPVNSQIFIDSVPSGADVINLPQKDGQGKEVVLGKTPMTVDVAEVQTMRFAVMMGVDEYLKVIKPLPELRDFATQFEAATRLRETFTRLVPQDFDFGTATFRSTASKEGRGTSFGTIYDLTAVKASRICTLFVPLGASREAFFPLMPKPGTFKIPPVWAERFRSKYHMSDEDMNTALEYLSRAGAYVLSIKDPLKAGAVTHVTITVSPDGAIQEVTRGNPLPGTPRAAAIPRPIRPASAQEDAAPKVGAPAEDFVAKAFNLIPSKQWLEIKKILIDGIAEMPEGWKAIEIEPGLAPGKDRLLFHAWDMQELMTFLVIHAPQETAGARGPSYSKAYYLLGATELELGDLKDAEDALDHGLKLEPDQPTLLSEKAFLYQKQKRHQEALDLYRQAATVRPWASKDGLARAWRGQGDCLIELGQLDAAESALRHSLQVSPGNLGAVNSIGFIHSRRLTSSSAQPGTSPPRARLPWSVQSANLLTRVDPVYPPLDGAARIEGMVTYDVTILTDGTIGTLAIVSGPTSLRASATEALRQWVFKPAMLSDQPAVVLTQIEVAVKPPDAH